MEERIAALSSDWDFFQYPIHNSWLCAPKAFRFLEKSLWGVGKAKRYPPQEQVPDFLQCADTYPSPEQASLWWTQFKQGLVDWLAGERSGDQVAADVARRLGNFTPVKRWLVRLYMHKLRRLEMNVDDGLAKLVLK